MFLLIRTMLGFKYILYLCAFTASATSSTVVCTEPQTYVICHCRPDWLQWQKIAVVITWQRWNAFWLAICILMRFSAVAEWCSFFFSPVRVLLIVQQCNPPFPRQLSLTYFFLILSIYQFLGLCSDLLRIFPCSSILSFVDHRQW